MLGYLRAVRHASVAVTSVGPISTPEVVAGDDAH